MSAALQNIQLLFGVCRIGIYSCLRRLFGRRRPEVHRENFNVLCLGLESVGKTYLLCQLAGEPLSEVKPTKGFHVKDIIVGNDTLHLKEIGGSDTIRPYWNRYYNGMDGLLFVVPADLSNDPRLDGMKQSFNDCTQNDLLKAKAKAVLVNCWDKNTICEKNEIEKILGIQSSDTAIHYCKDLASTKEAMSAFTQSMKSQRTSSADAVQSRV